MKDQGCRHRPIYDPVKGVSVCFHCGQVLDALDLALAAANEKTA